jgi:hypothetical protein
MKPTGRLVRVRAPQRTSGSPGPVRRPRARQPGGRREIIVACTRPESPRQGGSMRPAEERTLRRRQGLTGWAADLNAPRVFRLLHSSPDYHSLVRPPAGSCSVAPRVCLVSFVRSQRRFMGAVLVPLSRATVLEFAAVSTCSFAEHCRAVCVHCWSGYVGRVIWQAVPFYVYRGVFVFKMPEESGQRRGQAEVRQSPC